MAKRARRVKDDSDSDYDESYASSAPAARARSRPRTPRTKKPGTSQAPKSKLDGVIATEEEVIVGPRHGVSRHRIADPAPLRCALLKWYARVHESRGMPWRKAYDPTFGPAERAQRAYEVWISEIMLQQTQVATVIPYYNRWMGKFPTIKDLAASDIETVNALWKGLGYYSRAARLLQGAQKAVEELGGRLPDNAGDMEREMPGIGRYSAGAICSIAYNQCVPVLDGNVHRLLSRVLALYAPPKAKQSLDILWAGAAAMVEGADRPGDINQSLIELGSTVCKVRDPACGACPLQPWCGAYRRSTAGEAGDDGDESLRPQGVPQMDDLPDVEDACAVCEPLRGAPGSPAVTMFPMKVERKKAREELDVVNVVEWRHAAAQERWFLLIRRPEGGLLAGLHEFPTEPNVAPGLSASATRDIPGRLLARLLAQPLQPPRSAGASEGALTIVNVQRAGDVVHVFSHIKKTYRVQWVLLEGGDTSPPALATATTITSTQAKTARASSKRRRTTTAAETEPSPPGAMWLPYEAVSDANIGTGVLKVWRQACALWG